MDETRYAGVAWEMWRDGNFLVPHLNGETYSHKPPLLFWLINLGWAVLGVNDWWPRLVAPGFGLGSLFLTAALARRLWPGRPRTEGLAPLILLGALFWTLFTTLTMFDMMLAFFALAGMLGLIEAWRDRPWIGFGLVAVSIGLGVLAKGPAILLHLLPAGLLAPLWAPRISQGLPAPRWSRWYFGLAAATAAGAALALAWAVPAAKAGGDAYAQAIFWGQSAGRMVDSFAHGRPWWWFAAVLAPLILPWIVWPPLWRAARAARLARDFLDDGGRRLCLIWFAAAFAVFSVISGKQLHYLLPEFPALALLAANLADGHAGAARRWDQALPGVLGAGTALAVVAVLGWGLGLDPPSWSGELSYWWFLLPAIVGVAAAVIVAEDRLLGTAALTGLSAALIIAVHLAARPVLGLAYDLGSLSERLGQWQRDGYALAHNGKYHGQFHYLGRLAGPVEVIGTGAGDAKAWAGRVKKGKLITYQGAVPGGVKPDYVQRFRGRFITVWDRGQIAARPSLTLRTPKPRR